jgi:hypothetical protein
MSFGGPEATCRCPPSGRHGDGAPGPGGPERPGGHQRAAARYRLEGRLWVAPDDEGFHPTVLVYWRNRIRTSPRPQRILQAVRQVVEQTGVLFGQRWRVLDSTVLEDAVATQDTVTQLVAAIRRVRRLVAAARETGARSSSWMAPEPSTLSRLWSGRG